jgi:hypothetical protein
VRIAGRRVLAGGGLYEHVEGQVHFRVEVNAQVQVRMHANAQVHYS